MSLYKRSLLYRYGASIAAVALGLLIRIVMAPWLPHSAAFQTSTIAVIISAWVGGLGPGLLATLLGIGSGIFLFIAPHYPLGINLHIEAPSIALYVILDIVISILFDALHRERSQRAKYADELYASERRFFTALSAAPLGMGIYDPEERIMLFANPRLAQIFGMELKDLIGYKIGDADFIVSRAERDRLGEILRDFSVIRDEVTTVTRKSGESIVCSISIEVLDLGARHALLVSMQDITKRKQSEGELAESERKYRAIVEGTNALLFTVDPRGVFTYANEAASIVLGYPPEQIVGRFYLNFVHPGDRKWVHQTYRQQLLTARQFTYMEFRYEGQSRREGWVSFSVSPIIRNNVIVALSGVAQEITKRKQTEEALRFSEQKHRLLFETMGPGAIYHANDGKVFTANRAALEILGLGLEDLVGKSLFEAHGVAIREDGSEFTAENYPVQIAFTAGREIGLVRMGIYNPVKKMRCWLEMDAVPQFIDGNSSPYQVYSTFSDITAQKEAEEEIHKLNAELEARVNQRTEQLTAANKELESFSYSISHDLRAPLRAINGFTEIVIDEYAPAMEKRGADLLRQIRRNAKQMGQLIDDLLAFSRLSRESMNKQEIDMLELVQGVVQEQRNVDPTRSVEVSIDGLGKAVADPALVRQAWINLISNAFKFTRNKQFATIEIGTFRKGGHLVYFIKDNGAGFSSEYKKKLFGVFQRLHSADEFEGTGIGLALVSRIIQRHGGTIWAEGEVERGASFFFTLEA